MRLAPQATFPSLSLAELPTFKGCLQLIDILGRFLGLKADAQEEFLEKSNACEATP